jgi:hypothetical protein
MPFLRRSDCVFTAYGFLSCCNCCDAGESAGKLYALCGVGCLTYSTQCTQLDSRLSGITTIITGQKAIGSENAVWPPDDGRKDAWNMLRNNWVWIKSLIVASSWSHFYSLIKDARSFEYKVCHTNVWNFCVNYEFCRMFADQDQQIININQSETISGYSKCYESPV